MKSLVIAWTTHREIVRWPLFWLLAVVASALLVLFVFVPYFTLGEDTKMFMDQGLVVLTVTGLIVALFSAGVSIAEEIEGRTALTLLSKPIARRDFILGKFFGIMSGVLLLFVIVGAVFLGLLFYKLGYDAKEFVLETPTYADRLGVLGAMLPGLVLAYFKVTMLCALSVAFSTRFPVHWNISMCIVAYLLGHLAPLMVQASEQGGRFEAVRFLAQFFATVLPGLEYFDMGPAIATDQAVPWVGYVLPCLGYCVIYTSISLLLALLLFEDRDLA